MEKQLIYANSAKVAAEYMEKHLIPGDSDFLNGYIAGVKALAEGLGALPTVDAVEVVHARWIWGTANGREYMKCSDCLKSQTPTGVFTYCPNCGAKMDGEKV